ncbi:Pre-mRNA-splicing factor cef1 [Scheffersomyces spartinae]|uniref:Pre-mRNA-splicing factor CEF1 n=1 Tax=Scheffersomyces spartinae TaxID=45513 RepID=A0A9P8AGS1_9ASCO|nr:Pre-mRNA-splicing factor cef1 [Scheffersomyces spartinae]KAG7191725.1 Pre-mRNA-splicing factor cef1 [Scheffersomyces spartinae]
MSIYIKGGAWTNIEDEILKAAVSKYGLNQWDRVASLLTKKNAKQAKARWKEWLSPTVVRNLWTKEQDSQLLSLAKLFPNQWKSVASTLGRTATQCAERYEHLLAVAAGETGGDDDDDSQSLGVTGPGIETLPAKGGETNYEARPSLPDEEQMDDDEREMLSEARARLANTKGKKAKRKERERMLEESRRVALLQKRRELKAAGILMSLVSKNKRAKKEFDYVSDIPHEMVPVTGLYDVSEETRLNEQESRHFQTDVRRQGIDMNKPEEKKKRKQRQQQESEKIQADRKHKLSIEAAAQLVDEFSNHESKKRKIELSKPIQTYMTSEDDNAIKSIDSDILLKSKDLLDQKAQEVTPLLLRLTQDTVDGDKKEVSSTQKPTKIRLYVQKFLKDKLTKLPSPKKHARPIDNGFNFDNDVDAEEELDQLTRNTLDLLVKVDHELSKLRRSQAVQKGLPIPDPKLLKEIATLTLELDKLIAKEYCSLVKSDYTKYEDSSYGGTIIDELDEELFKITTQEIQKETNTKENTSTDTTEDTDASASETTISSNASASEAIELLNKIQDQNKQLSESIAVLSNNSTFESSKGQLLKDIHEAYVDLVQATTVHNGQLKISEDEQRAISNRSTYWNTLVALIAKDEQGIVTMYRDT